MHFPVVHSHTYMVRMGATKSSDAISTPTSASKAVKRRAKLGSPFKPVLLKKFKNESKLSLAMACKSLGAPVSDWRPAPIVEKRAPIRITHFDGHANNATVKPAESPYWSVSRSLRMVAPKNNTHVMSA